MRSMEFTIKGISPLLMHRFPIEPIEALEKKSPEEQARIALYENGKGPYIPGENIQRALVAAAVYSKGKGRASLQKVVAAAVFIRESYLYVTPPDWIVDSRPVVISATRGRIVRHRPRFDVWEVSGTVEYEDTLVTETQLRKVFDDTGSRTGLLDFRPERKGSFGRFMVSSWK